MKSLILSFSFAVLFLTADAQTFGGMFHKHKPENVQKIEVSSDANASTTLGSSFMLTVKATESNGKKTYSFSTPEIPWTEFDVVVKGGTFQDGKVVAAKRLSETEAGSLSIKVSYKTKPELDTTFSINLVEGKDLQLDFNGKDGNDGASGQAGSNGRVHQQGDQCVEGEAGQSGESGYDGEDAPEIEVYLKKATVSSLGHDMICVLVVNMSLNDTSYYYMDLAGSMTINCNGGNGGNGGRGGQGGIGSKSTDGTECKGGSGGNGGNGGNAGNGGKITVHVDPGLDLSKYKIKFVNTPGSVGAGGYGAIGGAHGENTAPVAGRRGADGSNGKPGRDGKPGPKPFIKSEAVSSKLFGI